MAVVGDPVFPQVTDRNRLLDPDGSPMTVRRSATRSPLSAVSLLALIAIFTVFPTVVAPAAVTSSVSGTTLTVNGDAAADSITVTCVDTNVKVNGADPGTGPATCASIFTIQANRGGGDDNINLSGVSFTSFTALCFVNISGGDGMDNIAGSATPDTINGDAGNDMITGNGGDDTLSGGDGLDTVYADVSGTASLSDTQLTGGGGTDTHSNFEIGSLFGSSGDDVVSASSATIRAILYGRAGNDQLTGGAAGDVIWGEDGNDTLVGGLGDDWILPGTGNDTVDGGGGTDTFQQIGASLNLTDTTASGPVSGDDTLTGIEQASVSVNKNGFINASGFSGPTWIEGANGAEGLAGGSGIDNIEGGGGNDSIRGFGDDDELRGDGGADKIFGGDGNDLLVGGTGPDTCKGNGGTDRFKTCEVKVR